MQRGQGGPLTGPPERCSRPVDRPLELPWGTGLPRPRSHQVRGRSRRPVGCLEPQLERLVELPVWQEPSTAQTFLETREQLSGLVTVPAHHALLVAVYAQGLTLGQTLLGRGYSSKAHLTLDERRWMGRLLWEVGARLRALHSHRALDLALRLQVFGSEQTGHSPTRLDSISLWVELGRWEKALEQAAFHRWPLASLQEESCEVRARDEHAWMKAFAG